MNLSEAGAHFIQHFEGCCLTAYPDPGTGGAPYTIGYGHTGPEVYPGLIVTIERARQFFDQDVQKFVKVIKDNTADCKQNEFDAFISFTYNVGPDNFITSTLLKKYKVGDKVGCADEFLKWEYAAHKKLPGLVDRREAERRLFLEGVYV